jgi:hypothetical protein
LKNCARKNKTTIHQKNQKKCVVRDAALRLRVGVLHNNNNNIRQVGKVVLVVNKRNIFFFLSFVLILVSKFPCSFPTTSFAAAHP